jgi:hypothetical protein
MNTQRSRVTRSANVLAAIVVSVAMSGPVSIAAAQTGDLPPAREIVDRFVAVIGGADAVRKYKSRRAVGTFNVPAQGITGTLEVLAAAPDRQVLRIHINGVGEIQQGYDGRIAWLIDPMTGPRLLEGAAYSQMQMDADFYGELHDAKHYTKIETVAREEFEGIPAYKVRLIRPSGEEDFEYFAVDGGLLVGNRVTRMSPMGPMPATTVFGEYKDVGGVRLATRVVQKVMGVEQIMTLTTIEHDTLDASVFALPASIKALVK